MTSSDDVYAAKVKRMRYVRGSKRTWRPRKTRLYDEDWLYIGHDDRLPKEEPDLTPNMQKVYQYLSHEEKSVGQLVDETGLKKSQVAFALEGLHYRHMVDKNTDGRRVWWLRP